MLHLMWKTSAVCLSNTFQMDAGDKKSVIEPWPKRDYVYQIVLTRSISWIWVVQYVHNGYYAV